MPLFQKVRCFGSVQGSQRTYDSFCRRDFIFEAALLTRAVIRHEEERDIRKNVCGEWTAALYRTTQGQRLSLTLHEHIWEIDLPVAHVPKQSLGTRVWRY